MLKKILLTIAVSCTSFAAIAQDEEVIVTGSYIKTSPTDGASPVEIIGRDTIQNIGAIDIADITANLAINSGSENQSDSFTSGSIQGRNNVNLRGLGLSSTLVLIDGKRQTLAGATANDGSVFVDTAVIPTIALDRVEVLKEGAASIYGSDAIAGVINYVFRRDFVGTEVNVTEQMIDAGNSTDSKVSAIFGMESGDTNFVFAASSLRRTPMSGSVKDLAPLGVSGLGTSFRIFADATVSDSTHPYYNGGATTPVATTFIGDPNCVANGGIILPDARCGFKFGPRFNIVNDETKNQVYASVKSSLTNGMDISFDVLNSYTRVYDNPQSPSYPALSYLSTSKLIAVGKGGNPFNVPVMWYGRPLASAFPSPLAPRTVDMTRMTLGLEGTLNNGFDFTANLVNSVEEAFGAQPDTSDTRLAAAINGTGGASGDQTFDLFVPSNNSQALRDFIAAKQETTTEVDLTVADFTVTGSVGDISIATGIQSRRESIDIDRNAESIVTFNANGSIKTAADLIFLGGGVETDESRTANAVFVEAQTNLTDNLEIKGALRYESLDADSTFDPKISLRYEANDDLVLRASVSTSFREASLAQMYASTVGLEGIQDYNVAGATVGSTTFIRIASDANPNLLPEEADNLNVGLIWSPTGDFQAKLDYWAIDYTNKITKASAQGVVQRTPTDANVIRTGGTLTGVVTPYFNASSVDTNGVDIELAYAMDTDIGQLNLGLNATHMLGYDIPIAGVTTDVVGLFNHDNFASSLPETKAVVSANLISGDHSAAAYYRHVASYKTTRAVGAAGTALGFTKNIGNFDTLDLQYSYTINTSASEEIKLTAGIKNALDEDVPMFADSTNWSYDSRQHDPRGRIFSVGFKYSK